MSMTCSILLCLCLAKISSVFAAKDTIPERPDYVTLEVIKDYEKRLDAKDELIHKLVEKLEERDIEHEASLERLYEIVQKQSSQISNLENTVRELQDQKTADTEPEDKENGPPVENKTERLKTDTDQSVSPVTIGTKRANRRHIEEDLVAFYASLTKPVLHLGVGQNILFDNVITNIGNAYNPHHGIFIAPFSGTYVFSVTLVSYIGHNTYFHIAKNGQRIGRLYVSAAGDDYDTSSQTIIVYLNQGDDLAVQNETPDDGVDGNNFSSFSGFILKQDGTASAVIGK